MRSFIAVAVLAEAAGQAVPLTLLPQDKGDESPACLDGSPYGIYFRPSTSNSTKWTIHIQGGAWCYDEADCFQRSQTQLGSSKHFASTRECDCMNVNEDGSMDDDCNCLDMPYGDGASFSGFRAKPWVNPQNSSQLMYFRGIRNLDATLDWAFQHGLSEATEFVLTGHSAGGLSAFLHTDRVAARVAKEAPHCTKIRSAPWVGYFLDHANFAKDSHNFTAKMKYIYNMQNLTFGADGGLTAACRELFPENPHYCFMSPHMQSFIKTPFFMFNSKFDAWQLGGILQTTWETDAEKAAVLQYGKDFMEQFKPVQAEGQNGAMITSCICHGCPWEDLVLENKTSYQHYADWFHGRTRGAAAIHIDTRGPNGDGALTFSKCKPFSSTVMV